MIQDGQRVCDGCGQTIPKGSKLFAREPEGDGAVDLCLQCRIRKADEKLGRV